MYVYFLYLRYFACIYVYIDIFALLYVIQGSPPFVRGVLLPCQGVLLSFLGVLLWSLGVLLSSLGVLLTVIRRSSAKAFRGLPFCPPHSASQQLPVAHPKQGFGMVNTPEFFRICKVIGCKYSTLAGHSFGNFCGFTLDNQRQSGIIRIPSLLSPDQLLQDGMKHRMVLLECIGTPYPHILRKGRLQLPNWSTHTCKQ